MGFNIISALFGTKCNHEHVALDKDFGYCPDCGALIENQWIIVRCSCCGMKHKAIVKHGKIVPVNNFCHNCGSDEYKLEKLDKMDFVNANYAVLMRKEVQEKPRKTVTQCWVDYTTGKTFPQQQLLPQYL